MNESEKQHADKRTEKSFAIGKSCEPYVSVSSTPLIAMLAKYDELIKLQTSDFELRSIFNSRGFSLAFSGYGNFPAHGF